jgi:hypothetical protein
MKQKTFLYLMGGLTLFGIFRGRGFTFARTPNFSKMKEPKVIQYLRSAWKFDDQKVNEFMSGYRQSKAIRYFNAPDLSSMTTDEIRTYIDKTFGLKGPQSSALLRSMDSYLKMQWTADWYRVKDPELRAFLRKTYGFSELQIALLFHCYQALIHRIKLDRDEATPPAEGSGKSWLSWEIFSWDTLKAIPGALASFPQTELQRLMTPTGIAGIAIALIIGPEILAYYGMSGAGAAAFGVVDYWIAASNAKDIIDAVIRSGPAGGVAVLSGDIVGTFLGGGAAGSFLRQTAGSIAGSLLGFQLESSLQK